MTAPCVGDQAPKRGRPPREHRRVLDAVVWVARTGSPRCDLPGTPERWNAVSRQFRRWTRTWARDVLLEALAASGAVPNSVQMATAPSCERTTARQGSKKESTRQRSPPGSRTLAWWPHNQGPRPSKGGGPVHRPCADPGSGARRDHTRRSWTGPRPRRRCSLPTRATMRMRPGLT